MKTKSVSILAAFCSCCLFANFTTSLASTWKTTPVSSDWNTAANWTPAIVPNGAGSHATFGSSNLSAVSINIFTLVRGITFAETATEAFTITLTPGDLQFNNILAVGEDSIVNDSGVVQNFVVQGNNKGYYGLIIFQNGGTAGSNTSFTTFGGVIPDGSGGSIDFEDTTSAAEGTFINNAASATGAQVGATSFDDSSTAADSVLQANGGENGNAGGAIRFWEASTGGSAQVKLFGNGNLDISGHDVPGVALGSVEGDGQIFLGANNLTVGTNDQSTIFSGTIQDGGVEDGTGGSVTKSGSGRLILTAANTYTGGTTINGGTVLVNNTTGSGLGTGPVQGVSGIFGGSGVISGRVTMGTGRGTGTTLGPGANSVIPGTLTIGKQLALKSDATYRVTTNSNTPAADLVIADGVRILRAQIAFNEVGSAALPPGTVFTVISNTSSKPISGTFANLPDGGSITIGNNTLQADYSGGDGNDLTLTVVP